MHFDGLHQIVRPAVVEEEDALSHSPQRRGAELISRREALAHVVRETLPHVVDEEIREGAHGRVRQICIG